MDGGQQPGRRSAFLGSGATEKVEEEEEDWAYDGIPFCDKITSRFSRMSEKLQCVYEDCTLVTSKM